MAYAEDVSRPTVREQLITGAIGHIRKSGVSDLSTRTLAAAGGRSTMCLYTKFQNRQGLLDAVHAALAEDLLAQLSDAADPGRAYWDRALSEPGAYAFLFGADPGTTGVDPAAQSALITRVSGLLDAPGATPGQRWALLHGLICLARAGQPVAYPSHSSTGDSSLGTLQQPS